jgi:UDP-3-O-[3-hydroxymyristoyl] glucosamine N-acyltransferase
LFSIESLKEFDPSIEVIIGDESSACIEHITDSKELKSNGLLFLKNKKHYSKLVESLTDSTKTISLIVEAKLFEKLEEEKEVLKNNFLSIATCEDASISMSYISRPFWDRKFSDLNEVVDGRQMGSGSIHPSAWIAQGVFIAEDVQIEANVKIHSGVRILSGSKIGENTEIYPNVVIYPFTSIGKNCRIHSGTVIGADGFGYNHHQGVHLKVWHVGDVNIGDDVEIGANSCVDRGTFSSTNIGDGTKLDNHVQIGHNVQLGRGVIICGHVAIGGSAVLGDYCVMGGKSGMGDNFILGKGVQVAGGGLVNCDWPDGSIVGGHPARPVREWMKGIAFVRKESLKKGAK